MKRLLLSLAIFLLIFSTLAYTKTYSDSWGDAGFSLERQEPAGVEINYSIKEFFLEDTKINGEPMQSLHLPGSFLFNEEGAPDIPGYGRYIAIPQGATASLRIIDSRKEIITNVNLAPAPRIPLETEDGPLEYNKDNRIYSSNALYPANPVKLSAPTQIRGVDVVILGITPFQYNPVTKELIVYRDLRLEVSFTGGSGHFGEDRLRSRWWDPILQDILINYNSLPEVDYNRSSISRTEDYEYIIITPDNPEYIAWADSIKAWRSLQGIRTGVITLSEIGGNNASLIEDTINYAYNNWDIPPVAVLLLADYGTGGVSGNGIISPLWNYYCVSDNIYADVNGNNLPDIALARITAQNEIHLSTMVGKFLDYEREPPENSHYYTHPVVAGGWQTERWFILCTEVIQGFWENILDKEPVREYAIYEGYPGTVWSTAPNTNTVVNYFGPDGLGYIPATPSYLTDWGGNALRINNDLNSGAFFLQHRDHGGETGWGEPDYDIWDLSGLENDDLTFVFSINCLTGKFNIPGECFAEAFHRHQRGALGIIAASEVSYSFVNDTYVWGIYDNMWSDFDPGYGGNSFDTNYILPCFCNASGKYYLQVSNWPYNSENKIVTYYLFHHHGDAFSTVYTEFPEDLTVIHDGALLSGVNFFTVTADLGSFISLTVDGEIIGVGEGVGLFPIIISIPPQLPDNTMEVTVTKQNYYRYSQSVQIIPPSGPYVIYDSHTINDSSGNNNGEADYGEDIFLNMTLKNVGIETANDVVAFLSTNDDYITIIDSVQSYGTIPAEGTVTQYNAFELCITDNIPDQHQVLFDLEITGTDERETWNSSFTISVNAPNFSIGSIIIDDISGNNNGRLDPGETVNIIIPNTNNGHADSPNAIGTLSCSIDYITINVGTYDFGILNPGTTENAIFNISVSQDTPTGTPVPLNYNITAGSYTAQETFYEYVGLSIENFETGDFSSYNWIQGGNSDWTIVTNNPYEGTYCAKSGSISHNEQTDLSINVNVFSNTISFYRKVSSEVNYDYLNFFIDDVLQEQWAGEYDWSEVSYPVTTGNHTFKWSYVKDNSVSNGSDCGWIDYITFPPILPPYPVCYLNPTSIDFGEVFVGEDSTAQFTIQNFGGETLSGNITTPEGYSVAEAGLLSPPRNQISYSLDMGESQNYDLTFAPTLEQSYDDNVVIAIFPFSHKLLAVSGEGIPPVSVSELDFLTDTKLLGNYPNPVLSSTTIKYQLRGSFAQQNAKIRVYNIQGKLVKTIDGKNGKAELDVSELPTGIYFYQLKTKDFNEVKKMVLMQ